MVPGAGAQGARMSDVRPFGKAQHWAGRCPRRLVAGCWERPVDGSVPPGVRGGNLYDWQVGMKPTMDELQRLKITADNAAEQRRLQADPPLGYKKC